MENIWVIYIWGIFMWAQNNLWAYMGIFESGLMKLRPENLYLNNNKVSNFDIYTHHSWKLYYNILDN